MSPRKRDEATIQQRVRGDGSPDPDGEYALCERCNAVVEPAHNHPKKERSDA